MLRYSILGVGLLLSVLFLTSEGADAADKAKKKKKLDANALFQKLDKDNDSKISKDEFSKLGEATGKTKKKAKGTDKLFAKLDTNGDNSLSKEEFAKISDQKKKKKANS